MLSIESIFTPQHLLVLMCAVAAGIDWKKGIIPNWLTLPPLAIAPLYYLAMYGGRAALISLVGVVVCGLIPYLLFQKNAIGGGDVKLFAAMGAIGAPNLLLLPFEAQLYGFIVASVLALGKIAWAGSLKQSIFTMGRILANPFRSKANRKEVELDKVTSLRLGPSILIGLLIALYGPTLTSL